MSVAIGPISSARCSPTLSAKSAARHVYTHTHTAAAAAVEELCLSGGDAQFLQSFARLARNPYLLIHLIAVIND